MQIIFKEENKKMFGSTSFIGIGKRHPNLIYGTIAKKLREDVGLTVEELANEFEVRPNIINKIENQQMSLDDKMFNKYKNRFNVEKEFFFDLDLDTLILNDNGHVLKSFETSKECEYVFNKIMEEYDKAVEEGKSFIKIDFNDLTKYIEERGNE